MNNKWKKELEIIESLGKLYPKFINGIEYKYWRGNNYSKADWVYHLCIYQLKCRVPGLEEFMKENDFFETWDWYKDWFKITDEQCGKEN